MILSCDYGFDENLYITEGVDSTQTDLTPSQLTSLEVWLEDGSPATLFPSFHAGTFSYSYTVPRSSARLTLSWQAAATSAQISWRAPQAVLNNGILEWTMATETQVLEIVVRGSNLTKSTYKLTVTKERALSGVNTLAALSVGDYPLTPAFDPQTTSYTVTVPAGTSLTTLKELLRYTKGDRNQRILTLSWSSPDAQTYWVTIKVEAEDLSTKTYRIDFVFQS